MFIFYNWKEINLVNKNLFLLTGKLTNKSNLNVRCGSKVPKQIPALMKGGKEKNFLRMHVSYVNKDITYI